MTNGKLFLPRWDWCCLKLNIKTEYKVCFLIIWSHLYLSSCQGRATYDEHILTFSLPHANRFAYFLFPPFQFCLRSHLFSMNASIVFPFSIEYKILRFSVLAAKPSKIKRRNDSQKENNDRSYLVHADQLHGFGDEIHPIPLSVFLKI